MPILRTTQAFRSAALTAPPGWPLTWGVIAQAGSGDPVPFPAVEERSLDWLGLGVYGLLVLAVCLVAWRMARTPGSSLPEAEGEAER